MKKPKQLNNKRYYLFVLLILLIVELGLIIDAIMESVLQTSVFCSSDRTIIALGLLFLGGAAFFCMQMFSCESEKIEGKNNYS